MLQDEKLDGTATVRGIWCEYGTEEQSSDEDIIGFLHDVMTFATFDIILLGTDDVTLQVDVGIFSFGADGSVHL